MPKIKAKKVATPGSVVEKSSKKVRGRPKKKSMKAGSSRVGNYRHKYRDNDLQLALRAVQDKDMSLAEASKHYNVPKTTLFDRLSGKSKAQLGRPTELTAEEEEVLVERLLVMSDWAFPLTNKDLRILVKECLDAQGRTSRFVDNLPGREFFAGFMKRHPELSVRRANVVKRSRAAVSIPVLNAFFDNFAVTAHGISAENMYNYDETNLRDSHSS